MFISPIGPRSQPVSVWYIMDEFGSRIQQSLSPSVAMAVFFYIPTQMGFTVMWPIKDLQFSGMNCLFLQGPNSRMSLKIFSMECNFVSDLH